ncbi:hypothetical protein LG329_17540 [Virgibacillus necropolis]|uniref:tubby C-terminal domain-like protein n=1 Tax=Virgibacillus necropolis TaxID=163877 RepID=UPI00384B9CCF
MNYYGGNNDSYLHLVDKKSFDIGQQTSFEYRGNTFQLKQSIGDWAQIYKEGQLIAEWKSSLKAPFKAYFKLIDESNKKDELLFLGLFHTYLHAP